MYSQLCAYDTVVTKLNILIVKLKKKRKLRSLNSSIGSLGRNY